MSKEFEDWYFEHWSHGETTPVHHAHKKGCLAAWEHQQAIGENTITEMILPYYQEDGTIFVPDSAPIAVYIGKLWRDKV